MLNIKLPKARYNTTTYPSLEERNDGAPIPIAYGDRHNVIPVCANTVTKLYKVAGHAIHAIDEVRIENNILVLTTDYTVDLANGEFSILSSPHLTAGTTYYFVIDADYVVHGTNHIHLWQFLAADVTAAGSVPYADGNLFTIDNTGAWTSAPTYDLRFLICGKEDLADPYHHQIDNRYSYVTRPAHTLIGLRDDNARYWLAQSFKPTENFYCTAVVVEVKNTAGILGPIRAMILDAQVNPSAPGANLIGVMSGYNNRDTADGSGGHGHCIFPFRTDFSSVACDIEGAEKTAATIVDGADMLEDMIVNRLSKLSSILEPTALANFKTKRTQTIAAYIDRDMTFGEVVGKLESSLLFKLVPLHDGTYATTVYEADTVEVRPHFFDEHFLTFSMRRDFSAVKAVVKIKYDEDPGYTDVYKVAEADSDVAKFVYGVEDTLEVETYLKTGAHAATLAADYLGMYETPPLEITFEIRGYGLNLIPGRDKVKITRTRAAYANGTISGILFRIVKITKKPATASTEIVAIVDTQTY